MPRRPQPSSPAVSTRMRATRRRDTAPEVAVRQLLHAQGFRYRVDVQPERALRRRADIVFARDKLAVFIDGCFWHSCPLHATSPKANAEWWREKLDANIARDRDTDRRLEEAGWTVLRFWEHDDPAAVARSIASTMGRA